MGQYFPLHSTLVDVIEETVAEMEANDEEEEDQEIDYDGVFSDDD